MEWIDVKFSDFLKERKGRYKPNDESIKDLKRIEKIDFSGQIYLSDKPSKTDMILVKDGDLVISGINVEKGAMNIFHGEEDVVATIHYSSYTYDANVIELQFLKHFLKSKKFKDVLKEQVPGGIKTEIKPKHLLPLEIQIPKSLDEQRNVVNHLDELYESLNNLSTEITHQLNIIKDLRQAYLREAMQGLLVSNETSDNKTGADLLAEIQIEKAQLVKDKKIKKPKPLAPITEDETPFAIPENWTWCRVDDVSTKIGSGSTPKGSNYSEEGYPFFRSQNIKNEGLVFEDIKFISDEVQKQMIGTQVIGDDLLLNITGGSLGRCALVPNDFEKGNVSQHVCIIRGIKLLPKFYHFLVLSPYFQTLIFSSTTGAGREGLPKYNLELFAIPLPPLEIQERIVAKLNELMGYCDALEEQVKQSQQSNELLLQQVLREALGA